MQTPKITLITAEGSRKELTAELKTATENPLEPEHPLAFEFWCAELIGLDNVKLEASRVRSGSYSVAHYGGWVILTRTSERIHNNGLEAARNVMKQRAMKDVRVVGSVSDGEEIKAARDGQLGAGMLVGQFEDSFNVWQVYLRAIKNKRATLPEQIVGKAITAKKMLAQFGCEEVKGD